MIELPDEAVRAAVAAYADGAWDTIATRTMIEAILAAALPLVERAVRERIAREIEAMPRAWHFRGPGDPGIEIVSYAAAAAVARGTEGDRP